MIENAKAWSVRMADSVIRLNPDLSEKWSHEYGVCIQRDRRSMEENKR